jgi:cytoskeleton protein RodZ
MHAGQSTDAGSSANRHDISGNQTIVLQDRRSNMDEALLTDGRADGPATPTVADAPYSPVMATRMGADLRAARERVGCTLPAMAAHLRIRLPYLEAIEDGRIADLPGNAYAMGFVRTYASSLGLDADEISRRFRAEAAAVNRKTELSFPAPVPERGVPAGAMMLLGLVLVVGAYIGWYQLSGERAVPDPVRPVPERLAALVPPPVAPAPTPAATPAPAPQAAAPAAVPSAQAVLATLPPVTPPPPVAAATVTAAIPPASPGAAMAAPMANLPPPVNGGRIALHATADAWVQVRDRQGSVLLNRILRAGETWAVPGGRDGLTLTTGNAGGTELLVDGQITPPLGTSGAVRRDLPLNADAIKDGKLAALAPR